MEAEEEIIPTVWEEKHTLSTSVHRITQAKLLEGSPVFEKIAAWCRKHNPSGAKGTAAKTTMATIYFDTGAEAELYMHYKVAVGAKVDVEVTGHKLSPDVTASEMLDKISELNEDDSVHGILIQRPFPDQLYEKEMMDSVNRVKHVEEFSDLKASNIALDALHRVLDHYGKAHMLKLNVLLLGGLNIITAPFKAELERRYRHIKEIDESQHDKLDANHDTIIISELNRSGMIKADMLGPAIKLVVDLGFEWRSKTGDLDHDVWDMENLLISPSPGGVMPVLQAIMMERTIIARIQSERAKVSCLPTVCNVL